MRYFVLVLSVAMLAGCASVMTAVMTAVDEYGQRAGEAQGKASEGAYCRGNSTGWLLRLPEAARTAYLDYCVYRGYGEASADDAPEIPDNGN